MEPNRTPLIHSLLAHPMDGAAIEERSLATIDAEAPAHHFAPEEWAVVRRMIHSSADFAIADCVRFSLGAVDAAKVALTSGARIYADSNMIRAGLSQHACGGSPPHMTRIASAAMLPMQRSLLKRAPRACRARSLPYERPGGRSTAPSQSLAMPRWRCLN